MKAYSERISDIAADLHELGLLSMADALESMSHSADFSTIDKLEFLSELVSAESQTKMTSRLTNRLRRAHLFGCPQELSNCVDSTKREYLPNGIMEILASLDFISDGLNICILGPSDSGKSYLAKAIGIVACRSSRVGYYHCEKFLEEMVALKGTEFSKFQRKMKYFSNLNLLILDDFLLHSITDERELKVLFELLETRSELNRSTVICSQREPKSWASMMLNDEVASNAILRRATKHYTIVIAPKNN